MDIERLKYLWIAYQRQELSEKEKEEWQELLSNTQKTELLASFLDEVWDALDQTTPIEKPDVVADQAIAIITRMPQFKKKRRLVPVHWIATAAALLILGMTWVFWNSKEAQVEPGMNKATLTLHNGDQIQLDEQQEGLLVSAGGLTYVDGAKILDRNTASQQMVLETPRGGQYKVQLADGTKIFLNTASKLVYPSSFAGASERIVELEGEAYFEVAKDTKTPFLVHSKGQEIQVLGTKFMLSCYGDDAYSKTTLLEGAVAVKNQDHELVLKPNEQAVLRGTALEKVTVDATEELAWINGEFIFNKESLASIMKKLARWYNVDVVFKDEELKNEYYEGVLNRFEHMKTVLDKLEVTNANVKFEMSNKQVLIYKNK